MADKHLTYQGHIDDLLNLSTSLKVHLLYIKSEIANHILLSGSLVLGARRRVCGLSLEENPVLCEMRGQKEVIKMIWPSVEMTNKALPELARLDEKK